MSSRSAPWRHSQQRLWLGNLTASGQSLLKAVSSCGYSPKITLHTTTNFTLAQYLKSHTLRLTTTSPGSGVAGSSSEATWLSHLRLWIFVRYYHYQEIVLTSTLTSLWVLAQNIPINHTLPWHHNERCNIIFILLLSCQNAVIEHSKRSYN